MIDEPGSLSGIVSSPNPARGPLAYQRTSLAIFISTPPSVRSDALTLTIASCADSAENLFGAVTNGLPVAFAICSATASPNAAGELMPVPDGRAAQRQRIQPFARRAHVAMRIVELRDPAADHLSQRDRRRVLQVRAAEHHDAGEFARLGVERRAQARERGQQRAVDLLERRDVHDRRKHVVRRLAAIDVVVRMDRLLRADDAARELDRAVGDHLVGVHVRLRAGAGLEHDQRKFAVPAAVDDFLRRAHDQVRLVRRQSGPARHWRAPRTA